MKVRLILSLTILLLLILGMNRFVIAESWHQFFYWNSTDPSDGAKFFLEPQHEQWRIRWNYVHKSDSSYYLTFYIYMKSADYYYLYETVTTDSNLTGQRGFVEPPPRQFMVELDLENVTYLELWGEDDLDSIPEIPSPLILLLFIMATTLLVTIYRRKHLDFLPG